jgi:hypothetical protein
LRQELAAQERRLANDIRLGTFDPPTEKSRALVEHLRKMVVARLRISSPKSLP